MRRAGTNHLAAPPAGDPSGVCHHTLFGEDAIDNGNGTCTYDPSGPHPVTCPLGEFPNEKRDGCNTDRCSTSYELKTGALWVLVGGAAGYAASRAFFPLHPVRGALGGATLGAVAAALSDFNRCFLTGDKTR